MYLQSRPENIGARIPTDPGVLLFPASDKFGGP
jgi:hypothetical protein